MRRADSCRMRYQPVQQTGSSVGAGEERRKRLATPLTRTVGTARGCTTMSPSSAGSSTCACTPTGAWWPPEPRWSGRGRTALARSR
ncbi:hypothetical protein MHYP_G00108610 [Metynnis hypsauchen]